MRVRLDEVDFSGFGEENSLGDNWVDKTDDRDDSEEAKKKSIVDMTLNDHYILWIKDHKFEVFVERNTGLEINIDDEIQYDVYIADCIGQRVSPDMLVFYSWGEGCGAARYDVMHGEETSVYDTCDYLLYSYTH